MCAEFGHLQCVDMKLLLNFVGCISLSWSGTYTFQLMIIPCAKRCVKSHRVLTLRGYSDSYRAVGAGVAGAAAAAPRFGGQKKLPQRCDTV